MGYELSFVMGVVDFAPIAQAHWLAPLDVCQRPFYHDFWFLRFSTPNTTYGENIGALAITKVYSTWLIGGAAILAILLSCVGKMAAAIQAVPVMGGVSLLLYGVIGASGIRVLIESKVDYNKAQNLILTSVILIIGVSGAKVHLGAAELKGMALATVVGIALSLLFALINRFRSEEVVLEAEDDAEETSRES